MINLQIHREQGEYAKKLVEATNFGKRGRFDGSKRKQFIGMLAEVVLADAFGYKRPIVSGCDDGVDFEINGKKLDLKTMERRVESQPHYVNNLLACQANGETTNYIFSSLNSKTWRLEILGTMGKEGLQKYFIPKGTKRFRDDNSSFETKEDMYEIPNVDLHQVYRLEDIYKS